MLELESDQSIDLCLNGNEVLVSRKQYLCGFLGIAKGLHIAQCTLHVASKQVLQCIVLSCIVCVWIALYCIVLFVVINRALTRCVAF